MAYETLKYEVLKKDGPIELRRYAPFVTMTAKQTLNSGFNTLFRYISGENDQQRPIKMTVPVLTDLDEAHYISFTMPEKDVKSGYPNALNPNIVFQSHDTTYYLSYRFVGSIKKTKHALEALNTFKEIHHLRLLGEPQLLRYQGPFVPPMFRTHDVIIQVEESSVQ